jgi:Leucine-rich repeat (LRR) protein
LACTFASLQEVHLRGTSIALLLLLMLISSGTDLKHQVEFFFSSLVSRCSGLTALDLSSLLMGENGLLFSAEAGCQMQTTHMESLSTAIKTCKSLKKLDVSSCASRDLSDSTHALT